MSPRRVAAMMVRDLKLGRRSPLFMTVIVAPLLLTVMHRFDTRRVPGLGGRLGVVDHGRSRLTAGLNDLEGIDLTLLDSDRELRRLVENGHLDAGLVLPAGFDARVRAGERPGVKAYLRGGAHVLRRVVIAINTLVLVREVEGKAPPVDVSVETLGAEGSVYVPVIPPLVVFAFLVFTAAAVIVPALMLVEEREHGTLRAMLVTPATASEVLASRAILGVLMAMAIALLALAPNLSVFPGALLATIAVASVIGTEFGLIIGTVSRDARTAGVLAGSVMPLVVGTMALQMNHNVPSWVVKLVPTYWFIGPALDVVVGASLADLWQDLVAALGLAAVLAVAVVVLGRRMEARLASE